LKDLENFGYLWYNNPQHNPTDGGLKEEFISGDRKGTGVFQGELNKGSIAFLSDDNRYAEDDFFINEEFRGRGVGRWALETLSHHETLKVRYTSLAPTIFLPSDIQLPQRVKFIFTEPWATRINQRAEDVAMVNAANDGVQLFFRKVRYQFP
jgi:GNAT superfamily N-acetyltransferase